MSHFQINCALVGLCQRRGSLARSVCSYWCGYDTSSFPAGCTQTEDPHVIQLSSKCHLMLSRRSACHRDNNDQQNPTMPCRRRSVRGIRSVLSMVSKGKESKDRQTEGQRKRERGRESGVHYKTDETIQQSTYLAIVYYTYLPLPTYEISKLSITP